LEQIRSGELGEIQYVYAHRTNIGTIRHEENVIWSLAPHDVSMILSVFDAMPDAIQAHGTRILHADIADVAMLHLKFGRAAAHVFVSWLNPYKERRFVVVGSKAHAVFDDALPWTEKLTIHHHRVEFAGWRATARRGASTVIPIAERDVLREEVLHFLECVATGAQPRTGPDEALRVLRVLEAAAGAV
jgi:UDP-2-acetamido-3-amino-2,3-dideoxy-glucuronate N-acetyltransferase